MKLRIIYGNNCDFQLLLLLFFISVRFVRQTEEQIKIPLSLHVSPGVYSLQKK